MCPFTSCFFVAHQTTCECSRKKNLAVINFPDNSHLRSGLARKTPRHLRTQYEQKWVEALFQQPLCFGVNTHKQSTPTNRILHTPDSSQSALAFCHLAPQPTDSLFAGHHAGRWYVPTYLRMHEGFVQRRHCLQHSNTSTSSTIAATALLLNFA